MSAFTETDALDAGYESLTEAAGDAVVNGWAVVITQEADSFSSRPGNRCPFKPTYRIEYPGMPVTPPDHNKPGTPIPAVYGNRDEARRFARRKADGLPVIEIGFR